MAKKNINVDENDLQDEFLNDAETGQDDWLQDENQIEGQLAVDVYQTKENVVIKAPIAGVDPKTNLEVEIAEDVITIRGERTEDNTIEREHYYVQECYWGAFSRSIILPTSVNADKAEASMKNGVLTISIPKIIQDKVKKIKVVAS